jgi:hypothetical protein
MFLGSKAAASATNILIAICELNVYLDNAGPLRSHNLLGPHGLLRGRLLLFFYSENNARIILT